MIIRWLRQGFTVIGARRQLAVEIVEALKSDWWFLFTCPSRDVSPLDFRFLVLLHGLHERMLQQRQDRSFVEFLSALLHGYVDERWFCVDPVWGRRTIRGWSLEITDWPDVGAQVLLFLLSALDYEWNETKRFMRNRKSRCRRKSYRGRSIHSSAGCLAGVSSSTGSWFTINLKGKIRKTFCRLKILKFSIRVWNLWRPTNDWKVFEKNLSIACRDWKKFETI